MIQGSIVTFPTNSDLEDILDSEHLDIVSPFYSGWALRKLTPAKHSRVRLITRLPNTFLVPPPFLDNDPKPLMETMARFGSRLSVFALPTVHAKLYVTNEGAWLGSANFTYNGFSGVGELMLHCEPPLVEQAIAFEEFLSEATSVKLANLEFLVRSVESGLTQLPRKPEGEESSGDVAMRETVSYEDFSRWISRQSSDIATYLTQRMQNVYRMSGHAYSGFHGTFSFLIKNPDIGRALLSQRTLPEPEKIPESILKKIAAFVQTYGDQFGGPRGGTWRSKLSIRLGGTQSGGGAGDVLVKRLLVEVPHYMREKSLL